MNLFIDTHLDDVVIILFKDDNIIKEKKIISEKQNSTLIMPAIREVLDGKNPTSIVVCYGPGSFTGVRLGVTIAKTFAYTLNIPIRTISSLECMAVSIEDDSKTVAFSDKNGYYIGNFDKSMNLKDEYRYLSNDEFKQFQNKNKVYTNISLNYENIIKYAMKTDVINPHLVNPIYIKKLDVEK